MQFGNLEGLISGVEQVVFDREITAGEGAQSSISTGNILNGDEDGWYTIIIRLISGATGAYVIARPNNDTGTNYGSRFISAENTTVSNANYTGDGGIYFSGLSTNNSGECGFYCAKVYAKSGAVRLFNTTDVSKIATTTVSRLVSGGQVWSNTADNITNMTFLSVTNGLGVGTRIIILKSNNFTNGTPTGIITTPYIKGAWVRVGSQVLSSPASSVTFSGLDGDRDVVYYLSGQLKATGALYAYIRLNSDSGTNYGFQYLKASNTTVVAARGPDNKLYPTKENSATNNYANFNMIMFAKQGFVRPLISSNSDAVSGTTITSIYTTGQVWNNTNTNITSIVFTASANNFNTGSQFDLYALRPQG